MKRGGRSVWGGEQPAESGLTFFDNLEMQRAVGVASRRLEVVRTTWPAAGDEPNIVQLIASAASDEHDQPRKSNRGKDNAGRFGDACQGGGVGSGLLPKKT